MKIDQTRTTTGIKGTKGYVAPEWFGNMPVKIKVDFYSFGILLLELIWCRKSFEAEAKDEDRTILADWAYDCYKNGKLELLVENDEEAKNDMKSAEICDDCNMVHLGGSITKANNEKSGTNDGRSC